jgi:hypothetical protein
MQVHQIFVALTGLTVDIECGRSMTGSRQQSPASRRRIKAEHNPNDKSDFLNNEMSITFDWPKRSLKISQITSCTNDERRKMRALISTESEKLLISRHLGLVSP